MTNKTPDFLYLLDEKYFKLFKISSTILLTLHPSSQIFLYDVSPKPSLLLKDFSSKNKNINYIFWPESLWLKSEWVDNLCFSYFYKNFSDQLKYLSRKTRFRLFGQLKKTWIIDKKKFINYKKRICHIWAQKAPCFLDCLSRTDRNIIFLDADAFAWRQLHSIFLKDFDVALTLRKLNDVRIGVDPYVKCKKALPYLAINAGVILMRNNPASRQFIKCWMEQIKLTHHFLIEQTALSSILFKADPDAFKTFEKTITIYRNSFETPVNVILLECEKYNNTYIDRDLSFHEEETYVVHLKKSLHGPEFLHLIEEKINKRIACIRKDL